jgi:hypothetical protein
MNKLKFILCTLLFTSCVINKEVHIVIKDSSDVKVEAAMHGSQLKDLAPSLKIPLLP